MDAAFFLRIGIALTMISFGIHQFLRPEEWTHYIPNWLRNTLPTNTTTTIRIHSAGNILLGALLFFGLFLTVTPWVTLAWWISIVPFAFYDKWDIGMRDFTITLAVLALILLL